MTGERSVVGDKRGEKDIASVSHHDQFTKPNSLQLDSLFEQSLLVPRSSPSSHVVELCEEVRVSRLAVVGNRFERCSLMAPLA